MKKNRLGTGGKKALWLDARGQGSIEIMLIIISAIGLAFYFSTTYLSTQDVTTALVIAKNRVTEKMNLHQDVAVIEDMRFVRNSDNLTIRVFTQPSIVELDPTELAAIGTEIENSTPFSSVTIEMNPSG
jgi:hypothetical protein